IVFLCASITMASPAGVRMLRSGLSANTDASIPGPRLVVRQRFGTHAKTPNKAEAKIPESPNACGDTDALSAEATQLRHQWNITAMTAAVQKFNQAQECWKLAGKRAQQANALQQAGEIYFQIGDYKDSRDAYEQALKLWQELDDQKSRARY